MTFLNELMPGLASYPNLHPLVVHFPVALLPTALLFGVMSLRWESRSLAVARWLLWLGTAGTVVAVVTGLAAAGLMPHGRGTVVAEHRTFMLVTAGLALALSAIAAAVRRSDGRAARRWMVAGLAVLNVVLALGADRGALVSLRFRSALAGELPPVRAEAATGAARNPLKAAGDPGRGRRLYDALACDVCHGPARHEADNGIPPDLAAAGSRYRELWIQDYLLHPHRRRWLQEDVRPEVRMPNFQLSRQEAADLAAFLAARVDTVRFPMPPVTNLPLDAKTAAAGRELFQQYACRGCHQLGGGGGRLGPALDGVGSRLSPAYIYALLVDPKGTVPGTAMKDFDLWDDEARELTAYLTALVSPGDGVVGDGD